MPRSLEEMWRLYAETGPADDSPLYRELALAVAADPSLLEVAAECPPATHHPNHLLAAVRFLLLGSGDHPLARACAEGDRGRAVELFGPFVHAHRRAIVELLQTRRVQTNEVGRVAVIRAALASLSGQVDRPVALVDVGSSAGLNLQVDRCRIDYGRFAVGPADSPVQLECDLLGPLAPFGDGDVVIGWRAGLDRSPLDVWDADDARWLLACVWADQAHRIHRLAAAMELARRHPHRVRRGDAVTDLGVVVGDAPEDHHLVVLTTWVVFYLAKEQRLAFEDALAGLGRPVIWLSLEHPGVVHGLRAPEVPRGHRVTPSALATVAYTPGAGADRRFLGWAHPHGRWLSPAATGL